MGGNCPDTVIPKTQLKEPKKQSEWSAVPQYADTCIDLQSARATAEDGTLSVAPGETGKEWRVRVPYDEGIANRVGPEPCAGAREGTGEASVGECASKREHSPEIDRDRSSRPYPSMGKAEPQAALSQVA